MKFLKVFPISRLLLLLCSLFILGDYATAQTLIPRPCAQQAATDHLKLAHPDYDVQRDNLETQMQQWIQDNAGSAQRQILTIPVVVHVVYNTSTQNISDAQIQSQIDVLNEDFRRLSADSINTRTIFKPVAADTEIEFCLASRDPNGNSTTGITRTQTSTTSFSTNDLMKTDATGGKSPWPRAQYLNIWVVNLSGSVGGYAYLPPAPAADDGVVVQYNMFGRVGTLITGYQKGKTAVHEVGHYLGLYHTFNDNGSCSGNSSSTCATSGDRCCDTPADNSASFGSQGNICPTNQNSCTETPVDLPDMIENYMDYSFDQCQNIFTLDQKARMRASLFNYRSSLFASTNLACVPVNAPPTTDFEANVTNGCPGISIQFTDNSQGIVNSRVWTFNGGTPSTSTQQNPTVTYNTLGTYSVTLVATNQFGSDTETKNGYITISNTGTAIVFEDDFESASFATKGWTVQNPDNSITWGISSVGGISPGDKAAKLNFYDYISAIGQRDGLTTPVLNFTNYSNLQLTFDHAYRRYSTNSSDSLIVYISTNGGSSYSARLLAWGENGTGNFATNTTTTSDFTPSTAADWCFSGTTGASCFTIDLSPYSGMNNIRIKFESYNNYGNNLYLDNIVISGNCNISTPCTPPVVTISKNNTSCGNNNGSATANASGGTSPYTFSWSGGGTSATKSNLSAGSYTVTVSDGAGCTATATVQINSSTKPLVSVTKTSDAQCSGNTGAATSNVTSGTPPYTYNWSNGVTSANISGLASGTYTLTVTDAANCTATSSVQILSSTNLSLNVNKISDASCTGNTGAASATASGGTPPYNYSWSTGSSSASVSGLAAGSYNVTVTDAGGCVSTNSVNIGTGGNMPSASYQVTDVSCYGGFDGSISVAATGGTPPFNFRINNGNWQTTTSFSSLNAGIYNVEVEDNSNCIVSASVTISEPNEIIATVSVSPATNADGGTAQITLTGGTPGYNYSWSSGDTTAIAEDLTPGAYQVTVLDANNCEIVKTVNITFVGIAELENSKAVNIFPNPNNGKFYIYFSGLKNIELLEVYNIVGQKIYQQTEIAADKENKIEADAGPLAPGVYIFKLYSEESVIAGRFSVN